MTHHEIYSLAGKKYNPVTGKFSDGIKNATVGDYIGFALANGMKEPEICRNFEMYFRYSWTYTRNLIEEYLEEYQ